MIEIRDIQKIILTASLKIFLKTVFTEKFLKPCIKWANKIKENNLC